MNVPNFHILLVKHRMATNNTEACVKIISERFKHGIRISYSNEAGSGNPALDTAIEYLTKKGWVIIGKGEGKGHFYIIADTFQPLK